MTFRAEHHVGPKVSRAHPGVSAVLIHLVAGGLDENDVRPRARRVELARPAPGDAPSRSTSCLAHGQTLLLINQVIQQVRRQWLSSLPRSDAQTGQPTHRASARSGCAAVPPTSRVDNVPAATASRQLPQRPPLTTERPGTRR